MSFSVNTNAGAFAALQNLNATQGALNQTQSRINTGLKVASAKDNAAIYSIAQSMKGDLAELSAVKASLDRGKQIMDIAIAAGEAVSDTLIEMKEKAVAASQEGLDTDTYNSLNDDFFALRAQIDSIVNNAEFDGVNLVTVGATDSSVLAGKDGATLTLPADDMSAIHLQFGLPNIDLYNATNAQATVTVIENALDDVNQGLSQFGATSKRLDSLIEFNSKLSDTVETGVGNLVDADLAKESANLQAFQTKQQLGLQALGIANQAPQAVLSLFR
ncbi:MULTISPECIES: flagellin [Kordiimonas]|jgi:flagellin|uniref:Flagellin n=1 Tax=Kordiimonas lacus TaxID=637679 RepID=A0A1G6XRA3_9PROT|nr:MULTISPECIES: flagellin [Kordiimonas]SDD80283.1 flagellin [Kordiimonas lacus]